MAEWFYDKINAFDQAQNLNEQTAILTEIKIKLGSLPRAEVAEVSKNLDLTTIFGLLSTHGREFANDICDILKVILHVIDIGELYTYYHDEILSLLSYPNTNVHLMVLNEILRLAVSDRVNDLIFDSNLLNTIIRTIAHENLIIAKVAVMIVEKIGKTNNGLIALYSGESYSQLSEMLLTDLTSFRVYDVIINISCASKEGLEASVKSGFLNKLIDVLNHEDVLLKVIALESITDLALTENGLNFLEKEGVLDSLAQTLVKCIENSLSHLLITGLLKFFGNLALRWPDVVFSKYLYVVSTLFQVIETMEDKELGIALNSLGYMTSTVKGKLAVSSMGESMLSAIRKISEVIQRKPADLKIRALNSLVLILRVRKDEWDERILSLTKLWFDTLCDNSLEMIIELCKRPFADIRQASLEVMAVVASQKWGQEYIASYPGIIEFLLDRSVEVFKECKEAKFSVIENLSLANPNIFDQYTIQRFKRYVEEGPLFVETSAAEVAIEGTS